MATAFASIVLPVPGGPNISTPFQADTVSLLEIGLRDGDDSGSAHISNTTLENHSKNQDIYKDLLGAFWL